MNPWMLQELAAARAEDARRLGEASRLRREVERWSDPAAARRGSLLRRTNPIMHPAAGARGPAPRGDGGRQPVLDLPPGALARSADPGPTGWRVLATAGTREAATAETPSRG